MNPDQPSYSHLIKRCEELEDQVMRSISVHDKLARAKTRLDDELQKFQLMQSFGQAVVQVDNEREFAELTLEYFIEMYNQEKGYIFSLVNDKLSVLAKYGVYQESPLDIEQVYINELLERVDHSCQLVRDNAGLKVFEKLSFADAYFSGIYNVNKQLVLIICVGYSLEKRHFFDELNLSNSSSFETFTHSVGSYFQNLKFKAKLQQEIFERRQIENELIISRQALKKSNQSLEQKVHQRTDELNKSYQKLKVQTQQLKKSNNDLRRFTNIVSHDLKTPLRSIGSFAGLLKKKINNLLAPKELEYLNIIERSAISLYGLIEDLLNYATVNAAALDLQETRIDYVVNEVLELLEDAIKESNAQIDNEINDISIECDRVKIKQVFMNIIQNAIKFSQADGSSKPKVIIKAEANNDQIVFSVRDNGIGISEKYQEQIFKEFVKLNGSEYNGSGMGLSICKSIVDKHNGRIWFRDNGQGTTFKFSIPIVSNSSN